MAVHCKYISPIIKKCFRNIKLYENWCGSVKTWFVISFLSWQVWKVSKIVWQKCKMYSKMKSIRHIFIVIVILIFEIYVSQSIRVNIRCYLILSEWTWNKQKIIQKHLQNVALWERKLNKNYFARIRKNKNIILYINWYITDLNIYQQ